MRINMLLIFLSSMLCAETILLDPMELDEEAFRSSAHILSESEASQTQSFTVQDRLKNDVSFNVVNDIKGEEGLSFRGLDFKATEYVEDGIPVYRSVNGFVDTKFMMNSSDIYVNDGSSFSSLGVSAMGGEVQMNSTPVTKDFQSKLDMSVSSNDEYYHANVGSKMDNVYVQADAGYYHRSDYELSNNYDDTPLQGKGKRVNSDKDQKTVSLKSGIFLDETTHLAAKVSLSKSDYGLPPNVYTNLLSPVWDAYSRVDEKNLNSFYLYGDYDTDEISLSARVYYDEYQDTWTIYDDASYESFQPKVNYADDRLGTVLKGTLHQDTYEGTFVFKAEENTHIRRGGGLDTAKSKANTLKGSYLHLFDINENWSLDAAVSYTFLQSKEASEASSLQKPDDKEALDAQTKISYMLSNITLYAGIAKKSRMPSMSEMFTVFPWEVSNPNLTPEKSIQYTTGYQQTLDETSLVNLSLYYYDIRDLIIYRNLGYINREKAEHYGAECRIESEMIKANYIRVSYAFSQAQDSEGQDLELIPQHQFKAEDTITLSHDWKTYVSYQYIGSRYSSNTATYTDEQEKLNSYHLFDLQASYRASSTMDVRAGVKNIFDESYEWKYGYPSEGRSYYISLEWKI